jgi:very-short-patch-repair endonuclease
MHQKIEFICPFTNSKITNVGSYIRWKVKDVNVCKKELMFLIYQKTFGEITKKEVLEDFYLNKKYGLVSFLEEFGLNYKITEFLLNYHNIKRKTSKECFQQGAEKSKETNLKRYGVDQTFKVKEFNEKRKKTYLERYNVDNPFKVKNFNKKVEEIYVKRYGMSLREKRSHDSKAAWGQKTSQEKEDWLAKSILSEKCLKSNGRISNEEKKIVTILFESKIKIETQFKLKKFYYDILIPELNIIIEYNGTYWHADPFFYKKDDILPTLGLTAKEIWEKDNIKKTNAEQCGYKIIYLWSREVELKNNDEIFELIINKIYEIKNKENIKT